MMWLILLACHLLLVLAAYIVARRQGDRLQAMTEAALVLLVPVAGLVLVCGSRLMQAAKVFDNKIDPHKLMNQNDVFTNFISYDENVIPLHDTYLVDDVKTKRKVFLDAVKQNVLENPKVLKMATKDQDREIAYYAVSIVSGHVEELESQISQAEEQLARDTENLALLKQYAGLLQDYLSQDFIDKLTQRAKRQIYSSVLEQLLRQEPDNMDFIQEKIQQDILLENYSKAQEFCQNFQERYPDQEEPYMAYIRLYFAMREPEKLQQKLAELKAIPGELSPEALAMVRYWGGAAHEWL